MERVGKNLRKFLTIITVLVMTVAIPFFSQISIIKADNITQSMVISITPSSMDVKPGQQIRYTLKFGNPNFIIHAYDNIHLEFPGPTETTMGIQGVPVSYVPLVAKDSDGTTMVVGSAEVTTADVTLTFNENVDGKAIESGTFIFYGVAVAATGSGSDIDSGSTSGGTLPESSINSSSNLNSSETSNNSGSSSSKDDSTITSSSSSLSSSESSNSSGSSSSKDDSTITSSSSSLSSNDSSIVSSSSSLNSSEISSNSGSSSSKNDSAIISGSSNLNSNSSMDSNESKVTPGTSSVSNGSKSSSVARVENIVVINDSANALRRSDSKKSSGEIQGSLVIPNTSSATQSTVLSSSAKNSKLNSNNDAVAKSQTNNFAENNNDVQSNSNSGKQTSRTSNAKQKSNKHSQNLKNSSSFKIKDEPLPKTGSDSPVKMILLTLAGLTMAVFSGTMLYKDKKK